MEPCIVESCRSTYYYLTLNSGVCTIIHKHVLKHAAFISGVARCLGALSLIALSVLAAYFGMASVGWRRALFAVALHTASTQPWPGRRLSVASLGQRPCPKLPGGCGGKAASASRRRPSHGQQPCRKLAGGCGGKAARTSASPPPPQLQPPPPQPFDDVFSFNGDDALAGAPNQAYAITQIPHAAAWPPSNVSLGQPLAGRPPQPPYLTQRPSAPVAIGSVRSLFVDDLLLANRSAPRVCHQAVFKAVVL